MVKTIKKMCPKDKLIEKNVYMDRIRPHTFQIGKFHIFDNRGGLRPIANFKMDKVEFNICTGQSTLLYFLHLYFTDESPEKGWYLKMYQSAKQIIELTEDILLSNFDENKIGDEIDKFAVFLKTTTLGNYNQGEVYEISKKYNDYTINQVPFNEREQLRPQSFYLERKTEPPIAIDISKHHYFQIDGSIV
jgi:hypothetical protein